MRNALRSSGTIVFIAVAFSVTCRWAMGSSISGTIVLEKKAAKRVLAPAVYDLRGMTESDEPYDRASTNEFDQVAVWLESDHDEPAKPIMAAMGQRNRRFERELLVIPVGSTVEFPNFDAIFHNIFSLSRAQPFDLGYYPKGQTRFVKFPRAGIVQVYCHVHPNMYAAIVVTSSRWFGKPARDGSFNWSDVPPGKYRLMIWQKFVGVFHKDVAVPERGNITANVSIPVEDPENAH